MPYNPFDISTITGTWEDHASYSLGGEDFPLAYGTTIYAPAAGTWRVTGGTGEFKAGWVGSAGLRGILELTSPIGDMVAIAFQHLSDVGFAGPKAEQQGLAFSGASANGKLRGGDVHLHVHGLTANGTRVPFTTNIAKAATITTGVDEMRKIYDTKGTHYFVGPKGLIPIATPQHSLLIDRVLSNTDTEFNAAEIDMLRLYM